MDLLELEKHKGPVNELSRSGKLAPIISPLQTQKWAELLRAHPDQSFAQYILQGLRCGFHIGFKRGSNLRAAKKNMFSAEEHPEVIQKFLQEECELGQLRYRHTQCSMHGHLLPVNTKRGLSYSHSYIEVGWPFILPLHGFSYHRLAPAIGQQNTQTYIVYTGN